MRLVTNIQAVAGLLATFMLPSAIAVCGCDFPCIGYFDEHHYSGLFETEHIDNYDLPALCPVAADESGSGASTVGMWIALTPPGNETVTAKLDAMYGNNLTFAVFTGSCDGLICEQSQVHTDNSVSWDAVGGQTYKVLVSAVDSLETGYANYAPLLAQLQSSYSVCLANMPDPSWSSHKQKCSCTEDEATGISTLYCYDECANCIELDSSTYCYYPSFTETFDLSVDTVGSAAFNSCFNLGDGFSAVGETICFSDSTADSNCTLTVGEQSCSTCYLDPVHPECPSADDMDIFADCGSIEAGGFVHPCDAAGQIGVLGDFSILVEISRLSWEITPSVGTCIGEEGQEAQTEGEDSSMYTELQFDVASDPFFVNTTITEHFKLAVDGSAYPMVRCVMDGPNGDPDLKIRANDVDSYPICQDSRAGPRGDCYVFLYPETTELYISVNGYLNSDDVTVRCTTLEGQLTLNIPSEPFNISTEEEEFFVINVEDRKENSTLACSMTGETGDPDLYIRANRKDSEVLCSSTGPESSGSCTVTIGPGIKALMISVVGFGEVQATGVVLTCVPEYNVDAVLVSGVTSPPFTMSATNSVMDFATEVQSGDVAFCIVDHATPGMELNHSDVSLMLSVNEPVSSDLSNVYCRSYHFFNDEDLCLAYGAPYEQSVIYARVFWFGEEESDEMTIQCERANHLWLDSQSYAFDVPNGGFETFVLDVPASIDNIVCTLLADNGDVDLFMKVGQNLASFDFDCSSQSEVSWEQCELFIPSYGSSTSVFALAFGYADTTNVRLTCREATDPSDVSRGNPDLLP